MSVGDIKSFSVGEVLGCLSSNEWWVPQFQRNFEWGESDISALCESVLAHKPCGLITLWRRSPGSDIPGEPVHLLDGKGTENLVRFGSAQAKPQDSFAIIDGKQRCTALAIAFGGLRATVGNRKFSGRFFLNARSETAEGAVEYIRAAQVVKQGLTSPAAYIREGLFPLSPDNVSDKVVNQNDLVAYWSDTVLRQWLDRPAQWGLKAGEDYDPDDLAAMCRRIEAYREGIFEEKFAAFLLDAKYDLADMCDIFQTLNTKGQKVSTVDVIHAQIYSEFQRDTGRPFQLREWMLALDEKEGARNWVRDDKLEFLAQIIGATYIALSEKVAPREKPEKALKTANNADLLRLPFEHWKKVIRREDDESALSNCLGDFQDCVAGGRFALDDCPYRLLAAIYVALAWKLKFEPEHVTWTKADLDRLYRVYFWRNTLMQRFDLGGLPKLSLDLPWLLKILDARSGAKSADDWWRKTVLPAFREMEKATDKDIPSRENLIEYARTRYQPNSARSLAVALLLKSRPRNDLLKPKVPLDDDTQLHHIFPRDWLKNNLGSAEIKHALEKYKIEDLRDAPANLTPILGSSNAIWKAESPATALGKRLKSSFESEPSIWKNRFISERAYRFMTDTKPGEFWQTRAEDIATEIYSLAELQ